MVAADHASKGVKVAKGGSNASETILGPFPAVWRKQALPQLLADLPKVAKVTFSDEGWRSGRDAVVRRDDAEGEARMSTADRRGWPLMPMAVGRRLRFW